MKPSQGVIRFSLATAVWVAVGFPGAPADAADSEAAGRKHAGKANQLAAKNKCKSALPEFNRAYRTLKDPTLLFNRAECYRKLGKDGEAVRDYKQFLADMPETPNRAIVEARIASLREAAEASAGPAPAAGKEPPAPAAKAPAPTAVKESSAPVAKGAAVPAAKPVEKPAVPVAKEPAVPTAKPVEKPAAPVAKEPAAPAAKPVEKPQATPVHRAERWTD